MLDPRIRLRHIQAFLETARRGSVTRAATALHVTQPALSKSLAELEVILGVSLMTRGRAGIVLTTQGETFLHFAASGEAAFKQGLAAVTQEAGGAGAPLAIGVLPSVAARIIPEAVLRLQRERPGLVPRIVTGANAHLIEDLRAGALDLVVGRLAGAEAMRGLAFTHLYSERVALVVRPGHPLASRAGDSADLAQLPAFPVLMPEPGAAIRPLVERFLVAHGIAAIPVRIESVADAFGRAYTRRSDAVWFISRGVVALDLAEGALVELPFDMRDTSGPVGLALRPENAETPEIRHFAAILRAVAAEFMA